MIWYGKNYGLEKIVLTQNHIIRPNDNRYIAGHNTKFFREISCEPRIGLKDGLVDLYENSYR